MPFGMVSGVVQGMGVLDGGGDRRRGMGSFGRRRSVCLSVCLSLRKMYCKTLIGSRCRLGVVSGVGRGMGVLDEGGDFQRRRGSFGGEFGASHCNQ